jgi:CheY-like chemotaxis protein
MEQAARRKPLVLHVEDDDGSAFLFTLVLRYQGIDADVLRIRDGEEAIRFLARSLTSEDTPVPDVVVLDLNLPKEDGHEVLSQLREMSHIQKLPVIIFTSSNLPADRNQAHLLGADEYFEKSNLDSFVAVSKQVMGYISQRNEG